MYANVNDNKLYNLKKKRSRIKGATRCTRFDPSLMHMPFSSGKSRVDAPSGLGGSAWSGQASIVRPAHQRLGGERVPREG